ncbi:type IV pilus modification PilV family protein [Sediminibacillus terrae]|uniref:type IV pilus modification PilV family protein n=1 Tax=Sediminibacillus terrae TaxID=1562106 RepID=UPI00047BF3D4|nr:type II secretion system protein [Sediminibacillus terrae]
MNRWKQRIMMEENGMTLIEVVVSIAILSIIITSFFAFFAQAAKTNKNAGSIVTATYVAESYMEEVYQISVDCPGYTECKNKLADEYGDGADNRIFTDTSDGYQVRIELKPLIEDSNIGNVVVKVYESDISQLEAQMETTIDWKVQQDDQ